MFRKLRFPGIGAALVALALLAAACAPAPSTPPTSPAAAPAKPAEQAPSSPAPKSAAPAPAAPTVAPTAAAAPAAPAAKQEIVIVQGADPETLDPQATTTRSTLNVSATIAEQLVKVAFSDSGSSSVAPVLATAWKQVNDTTWQFKLRENVKFTNGEPFDAAAAKYAIERLAGNNKFMAYKYASAVARVDVVDKATINITTKSPYPLLPLDLTMVYMVPPKYTAEAGEQGFARKPVGTGPFKLVEWVKDDHTTLEANPDYWAGKPKLTKITFKPIPEASTRTAAIRTGEADIVTPLQISDIASVRQTPNVKVETTPSMRVMYVVPDQSRDQIMKNTKVRQAMNYAVDKDAIVQHIFQGYGTKLQGQALSPQYFGFNPNLQAYPYDPAKAKQLLAEAGYPNGFSTTMWTSRGRYPLDYETAQAIAGQLDQVGIKVEVKPLEWAVYVKMQFDGTMVPLMFAAFATYPDATTMFEAFRTGGTYSISSLPAFDKLLGEARATMDEKKRLALLQEAAKAQHDEALALFLHQIQNIYGVNNRVQGFKLLPNEAMELHDVSVK